jgi:DNA invertase Pin-like site-specific DNA recombinase
MAEGILQAATYYRMSTDRQEDSIERQRSQVEPHAQKCGYRIVGEYADPGVAGDEFDRRPQFQQLLKDARAGKFEVILADELSRISRQEVLDFIAKVAHPLRDAGVRIETVAEGPLGWDNVVEIILLTVRQDKSAQESVSTSRRILTQMVKKARAGHYLGGPIPYGLAAVPDPVRGKKLVPDGRKAEVVRLIFDLYDRGHSLRAVARELYVRGVAAPGGGARWTGAAVRMVLRQRKYTGDWTWNAQRAGKHHRLKGGEVQRTGKGHRYGRNDPGEWVVVPDTHEALVGREQFARVQARLQGRRKVTTPHPDGGAFLLTRLLVCGHCGAYLLGHTQRGRRLYCCGGYKAYGKDHCHRNQTREAPLVKVVLEQIRKAFLDPERLAALRAEVAALEEARRSDTNLAKLERTLAELEKAIRLGNGRLVTLPEDRLPGVVEELRRLEAERDGVRAELHRARHESLAADLEAKVAEAERVLWDLQNALREEDAPRLRQVLREVVSRVELHFTHRRRRNGQTASVLEGGTIYLRWQENGLELGGCAAAQTRSRFTSLVGTPRRFPSHTNALLQTTWRPPSSPARGLRRPWLNGRDSPAATAAAGCGRLPGVP